MALAFPLSLANLVDLLKLETAIPNLMDQQELSGLGTGEVLAHDLAPRLWEFDCATGPFPNHEVERWRSRFLALDGSINSFLIYPPQAPAPETDPDGTILGANAVTIAAIQANRKEMSFTGLPAGYVIPWGSYASIVYSTSRVALIQLLADATANGAGLTGTVEVRPHLRPGIVAGNPVTIIKPPAKVKLLPKSLRVENAGALHSRLRFMAGQTLAAEP
jgi:hypothetical protein